MIVSALPPARIVEGSTQLIPFLNNLCITKLIPTLRTVGSVGGIDVDKRSTKISSICCLLEYFAMKWYTTKKAIRVSATIM
jgi:hypothetical protein